MSSECGPAWPGSSPRRPNVCATEAGTRAGCAQTRAGVGQNWRTHSTDVGPMLDPSGLRGPGNSDVWALDWLFSPGPSSSRGPRCFTPFQQAERGTERERSANCTTPLHGKTRIGSTRPESASSGEGKYPNRTGNLHPSQDAAKHGLRSCSTISPNLLMDRLWADLQGFSTRQSHEVGSGRWGPCWGGARPMLAEPLLGMAGHRERARMSGE